jgi:hypothetical protein
MIDIAAALKDIDAVVAEGPKFAGGTGAVADQMTRFYACICRHAPIGTPHRRKAEDFVRLVPGMGIDPDDLLLGVLGALRSDIAAGRTASFEELVHADLFTDLLAQAEHLGSEGYRRAAAVLAGATLEEQLRKLAAKSGVAVVDATSGQPRKASALNADLYSKVNAYSKPEHAQVDAWQKTRNDAAHGEPNFEQQHNDADIRRMCEGIRDFIAKHPA